MAHFGDRLRQEREQRGISLEEIARSTKVAPHLLEALEGNRLDQLPGGPFNKGFVRAYALALGLDPDDLIAAYAREEKAQGLTRTPDADRELLQEMARLVELRSEGGRRTLVLDWSVVQKIIAGAAGLAVILAGLWLWLGGGDGPPSPATTPDAAGAAAPAVSGPAEPRPAADADDGQAATAPRAAEAPPPATEPGPAASRAEPAVATAQAPAPEPPPTPQEQAPAGPAPEEARSAPSGPAAGAPEPAPDSPPSRIRIEEAGVGTGVRGRLLVGHTDRFRKGDRVWFWNRAMDGRRGEVIRHVWLRQGEVMGTTDIEVGGPHWRNWSWKTMGKNSPGDWAVEVRDESGRVLERIEFTCLPADS